MSTTGTTSSSHWCYREGVIMWVEGRGESMSVGVQNQVRTNVKREGNVVRPNPEVVRNNYGVHCVGDHIKECGERAEVKTMQMSDR
jgi:hypothetical protein